VSCPVARTDMGKKPPHYAHKGLTRKRQYQYKLGQCAGLLEDFNNSDLYTYVECTVSSTCNRDHMTGKFFNNGQVNGIGSPK
jgi:hypothetical protein